MIDSNVTFDNHQNNIVNFYSYQKTLTFVTLDAWADSTAVQWWIFYFFLNGEKISQSSVAWIRKSPRLIKSIKTDTIYLSLF